MTVQDVCAIVTAASTIVWLGIAVWQLGGIKRQLKDNILGNVLSLESELNSRRMEFERLAAEVGVWEHKGTLDAEETEIYKHQVRVAKESWLNVVNRLCFCIKQGYFDEKNWKAEYRDYVVGIVANYPDMFNAGSKYTSILDVNNLWLRG